VLLSVQPKRFDTCSEIGCVPGPRSAPESVMQRLVSPVLQAYWSGLPAPSVAWPQSWVVPSAQSERLPWMSAEVLGTSWNGKSRKSLRSEVNDVELRVLKPSVDCGLPQKSFKLIPSPERLIAISANCNGA